ncbi:caspase-1-like [Pollicipes pollicipes]|uniref:caspase-1-like n=1 Tax=Pollicipes pollicipes TaxID=41117 RepID=UPI00188494B1|nr:caspase-1-like [Pollicipes pollicipes]
MERTAAAQVDGVATQVDVVDSHMETVDSVPIDAEVAPSAAGCGDAADAGMFGFGRSQPIAVARAPTSKDSFLYNMEHVRRGRAVIFNHRDFHPEQQMKMRNGTDVDRDALAGVLRDLDFEVTVYNDLRKSELFAVLDKLSTEDHNDADCIVVCFLSHGDSGVLYTYDEILKSDQLWARFTADRCPSLAGKPKIFFVQACQGDQLDGGTTLVPRRTATDGDVVSYKIPTHADFLLCFSTVPGYYSWRNTTNGSWFVQALAACLRQYGRTTDLLTVMTRVNRMVATDFQSNCPGDPGMHQRKQIPCISSMLTRDVIFSAKTGRR